MIIDLKARLLEEARARIDAGDFDGAVPVLEKVTRFARGDVEAVKFAEVSLAAHFFDQGDPRSVEHFRRALALDPEDDRVRYCLGHAHLDGDQFAEAAVEFEKALEDRPGDPEYLRSLGVALAEDGRLQEALVRLRAAARTRPDEPFVLKDLAQVLAACGKYEESVRLIRRAVALAPDEPFFGEVLEELMHLSEVDKLVPRPGAKRVAKPIRPRKQ